MGSNDQIHDIGEETYPWPDDVPIVHFESQFDDWQAECLIYLNMQRETLSTTMVEMLKTGYPLLLDGSRKVKANIRVYFEIASFVNNLMAIAAPEADSLLQMMKKITHMHGHEIPIPAQYKSILKRILRHTGSIKCRVVKHEFPLSLELFGPDILEKLPFAQGALTDIVKVISK